MVLTAAAVVFKLDAYAEIFTEWLGFPHITTLEFPPDEGFSFSIFSIHILAMVLVSFSMRSGFFQYSNNNARLGFPHSPVCSPNCTYAEGKWLSLKLTLVRAKLVFILLSLLILEIKGMKYRWTLWIIYI
jgi:hypothetical protein